MGLSLINTEVTYSLFPPFKPDCFSIPQMQRIFPSLFSLMNSFVLLFLVLSHLPPRLFRLITLIFCSCRGFVLQLCSCRAGCSWSLGLFFCVLEVCEESQTFRAGNCSLVTQKLEEKSHMKILRGKNWRIPVLLCDQCEVQFSFLTKDHRILRNWENKPQKPESQLYHWK